MPRRYPRADEFSIPKCVRYNEHGEKVETFDLSALRPLKGAARKRTPFNSSGTCLAACVNTRWTGQAAEAWINTQEPGQFFRRTYESRSVRGQMVPALARVRSLAVRAAILEARLGGYERVTVTHES
jgi:hypothetical protein